MKNRDFAISLQNQHIQNGAIQKEKDNSTNKEAEKKIFF